MKSRAAKFVGLRPQTATTPIDVDRYVRRETSKALFGRSQNTTPEFRQWLVKQAVKRGLVG